MKNTLGTILPTVASLLASDDWHDKNEQAKRKIAEAHKLGPATRIDGELRYIHGKKYAVVSRSLRVLWFLSTPEGDYATTR